MKIVKEISYSELRQNYIEVQNFLKNETLEDNISSKTRIEADLHLSGDDNFDLLNKFAKKYTIDFSNFNYDEHFESEGKIFNGVNELFFLLFGILNFLKFLLYLLMLLFSKITAQKIKNFVFHIEENKTERKDLAISDLITSKIFKKFQLRENVQFALLKS
jgi:hypothetical protein